jgi:predicted metalloprotease with PDZ domain
MLQSQRRIARKKILLIVSWSVFLLCASFTAAHGQTLKARITISSSAPALVRIDAESVKSAQSWSFRNAYAGVLGLGERIERLDAVSDRGETVPVRKIAAGEFRSTVRVAKFGYSVNLPRSAHSNEMSHASWLMDGYGFLMLADLLPQTAEEQDVLVEFDLPAGWTIGSALEPNKKNQYQVKESDKAVFFVGSSLRKTEKTVASMEIQLVASGEWPFSDTEVLKAAANVVKKYFEVTGFKLRENSVVMLAPMPLSAGHEQWKAETRGSSVMLLLSPRVSSKNWIAQLGVIFTHEIFHLWVPNSLRLQGDYDWFFEGFTLYEALLTALDLKLINFQEYLDTIARVYDSYLSYPDNLSLIEASEQRWSSLSPIVYDKGMLVAFMYDLTARHESNSKNTLADRYRLLFNLHTAERANSNQVIINLLRTSPATNDFARSYIESRAAIKLERFLPAFGLEIDASGQSTHLIVNKQLNEEQHRLLRSLGYRH